MRKGFLIVLVVVLAAAFAAPAMAGTDINGFYKSRAFLTNYVQYYGGDYGTTVGPPRKDAATMAFVEQRMRLKITSGEENVKAVAQFEIDSVWGDVKGNGQSASGGGLGTDATNIETKNAYVWFKVPNTSLDVTVGLQWQTDSYAGVFMNVADMAGIFVNGKADPVTYRLGWAKWSEGGNNAANRLDLERANDYTFYLAEAKFAPAKDVKVGANLYMLQNDMGRPSGYIQRVYMPGFDATFGAGPATINAWAFYQFGKYTDYADPATSDVNIGGFAADVRADLKAGPGKAFVEALYISGGDNNSVKYKSIVDAGYTNSIFIRTDMQILLLAADVLTGVSGLYASSPGDKTMGNGGRGLTHLAAGYTQKLSDKLTGKVGIGYLAATKLSKADVATGYIKKDMGTEFNASLNYSIAKGLDVGVVGAYALIGDFFKTSATDAGNPDNAFDLHARIGYVF